MKYLNKYLKICLNSPNLGSDYVKLDVKAMVMAVFVDASSNEDSYSQLGFLIKIMDANGRANIFHCGSMKAKRVARGVLASELFSMVLGFDTSTTMRLNLNDMFGRCIELHMYTGSKSLYVCIVRINSTSKKRLLIDLRKLRQWNERREGTSIFWTPPLQIPADALTKDTCGPVVQKPMENSKL